MVEKKDKTLLNVKTLFPFDLFSSHLLIIDERFIHIFSPQILFVFPNIRSIAINFITSVSVEISLLGKLFSFATLSIDFVGFTEKSIKVPYLREKDAMRVAEIIMKLRSQAFQSSPAKDAVQNLVENINKLSEVRQSAHQMYPHLFKEEHE